MKLLATLRAYVWPVVAPFGVYTSQLLNGSNSVFKKYLAAASQSAQDSQNSASVSTASATTATQAAQQVAANAATIQSELHQISSMLSQITAIYKTFGAAWLGVQSSDPKTDLLGNPLIEGAEYLNSTTNRIRVYGIHGWEDMTAAATADSHNASTAAANAAASSQSASNSAERCLALLKEIEADAAAAKQSAADAAAVGVPRPGSGDGNYVPHVKADASGYEILSPAAFATATGLAPSNSPVLTGNPTSVTPALNDASTSIATTAYVLGQLSNTFPLMDSTTGSIGTDRTFARGGHSHPTDITRANVSGSTQQQFAASQFIGVAGTPTSGSTNNHGFSFVGDSGTGLFSSVGGSFSLYAGYNAVAAGTSDGVLNAVKQISSPLGQFTNLNVTGQTNFTKTIYGPQGNGFGFSGSPCSIYGDTMNIAATTAVGGALYAKDTSNNLVPVVCGSPNGSNQAMTLGYAQGNFAPIHGYSGNLFEAAMFIVHTSGGLTFYDQSQGQNVQSVIYKDAGRTNIVIRTGPPNAYSFNTFNEDGTLSLATKPNADNHAVRRCDVAAAVPWSVNRTAHGATNGFNDTLSISYRAPSNGYFICVVKFNRNTQTTTSGSIYIYAQGTEKDANWNDLSVQSTSADSTTMSQVHVITGYVHSGNIAYVSANIKYDMNQHLGDSIWASYTATIFHIAAPNT